MIHSKSTDFSLEFCRADNFFKKIVINREIKLYNQFT